MSRDASELTPELQQVQSALEGALREVCEVDVKKANTGELIHVDELLAIAGDSAKKAITMRRRMRRDQKAKEK